MHVPIVSIPYILLMSKPACPMCAGRKGGNTDEVRCCACGRMQQATAVLLPTKRTAQQRTPEVTTRLAADWQLLLFLTKTSPAVLQHSPLVPTLTSCAALVIVHNPHRATRLTQRLL
jgi:hypothetical protein